MHQLLFLAFIAVSAAPLAVLAIWEARTAFQNELDSVRERHLLVARNLTLTLSRYVKDVKAAFALTFTNGDLTPQSQGLDELLGSLNVVHVCIVGAGGQVEGIFKGLAESAARLKPDAEVLHALRQLADDMPDEPVLSKLYRDNQGQPVFYLVRALPGGRMGFGVVSTRYLITLQRSIAFGDKGHAVITDGKGQVIAHPLNDWVAASRDISGVSVVQAMIRGETGVGQFYSPAFDGDMIAGYSVVPETGWGVMVPQPISELRRRANLVNHLAVVVAAVGFAAAALLSYLMAIWLSRPVRDIAATAEAVIAGNDEVSVPGGGAWEPLEIRSLGLAFNTMLDDLRRRAAETMRALREAETSNRAKGQFLANMSHELRTPLNGVVGMLELLRLSGVTGTQQSYVDQANRSAQSLLDMVSDVLDLSEMEAGTIQLKPVPFGLESLIGSLVEQFRPRIEASRLSLAVTLPDALKIQLAGDAPKVRQMLVNLVSNAIKFTDSGGIVIRAAMAGETADTIRIRFEVGDTGAGIPAGMQQRIFEAFAQGDSSSTRRFGGSGLGLAIVKQLTERMNGELGVQSIVGVGSTFWLILPFKKTGAEPAQWIPPAPRPDAVLPAPVESPGADRIFPSLAGSRPPQPPVHPVTAAGREFQDVLRRSGRSAIRVLLVEDNPANLRVTQALLETLGCEVRTARNGLEAVSAFRAAGCDLILMDCQMPDMDGYQAARAIRKIETAERSESTPIVALTAHAMEGSRDQCLAAGMNDQLSKPLTLAALTSKLLEWLAAARPAA